MIEARTPNAAMAPSDCHGCGGAKNAPIATVVNLGAYDMTKYVSFALCEECGRDAANAIGFMCIKDGGWSKLEPRKRRAKP